MLIQIEEIKEESAKRLKSVEEIRGQLKTDHDNLIEKYTQLEEKSNLERETNKQGEIALKERLRVALEEIKENNAKTKELNEKLYKYKDIEKTLRSLENEKKKEKNKLKFCHLQKKY